MASTSSGVWLDDFFAGFTAYYLTSLPMLMGVFFAVSLEQTAVSGGDLVSACFHMASQGRFAAVIFVNYLVLGRMLARSSSLVVVTVCTTLALYIFTRTFL